MCTEQKKKRRRKKNYEAANGCGGKQHTCERYKDKEATNALIKPQNSRLSASRVKQHMTMRERKRIKMNKCNRIGLSCQTNVYI